MAPLCGARDLPQRFCRRAAFLFSRHADYHSVVSNGKVNKPQRDRQTALLYRLIAIHCEQREHVQMLSQCGQFPTDTTPCLKHHTRRYDLLRRAPRSTRLRPCCSRNVRTEHDPSPIVRRPHTIKAACYVADESFLVQQKSERIPGREGCNYLALNLRYANAGNWLSSWCCNLC